MNKKIKIIIPSTNKAAIDFINGLSARKAEIKKECLKKFNDRNVKALKPVK